MPQACKVSEKLIVYYMVAGRTMLCSLAACQII